MNNIKYGYMCKTDFIYHLEEDVNPLEVYKNEARALEHRNCVSSCGLVKVKIECVEETIKEDRSHIDGE